MRSLLICGAGGHAKVVADLARRAGWSIVGFVDEFHPERLGDEFFGGRVVNFDSGVGAIDQPAVALGIGDCESRLFKAREFEVAGRSLPVLIHPCATVAASVIIGAGSQVVAGAVINPDALLGQAVIVNTGATVDHDCMIEDGVHLAPGVHLAGNVTVGEGTLVGIGAVVKPGVRIGRRCVIGAGSVVLRDIPDGSTAFGFPARIQSTS